MTNPDTNQNLRELLERLHNELEQSDSVDEQGNEMLRHLDADIRRRLERSDKATTTDQTMLEQLEETIDHFETTHPRLTLTLSEIMTILSNAGI